MNIALTGSSGLIGLHLLQDLKNLNYNISCISSSHSSSETNIFSYEDMLAGKISQPIDFIIHLASINSEMNDLDIPLEVAITEDVIKSMPLIQCKKIIFFSSAKVYGDNSFEHKLILESSSLNPSCAYGKAKSLCEEHIIKSAKDMNFNYLIFRMPPLLINHPKSNVGKIFQFLGKGFPIPSFAVGDKNSRSFLSYKLLYSVLESVLKNESYINNEIFNLSDTHPRSTNELFREIAETMQKNLRIIYFPNFLFQAMLRVNRLQLVLCRLFGNFNLSSEKLRKTFNLVD
ncbi:NAD-dependent epimerase/dehydratase family protein [bacterium]|jgi:nucleoside-diphosphate-sugar epimerase|nr:NAD-dependent epimerase/dehydratase family protein [bacterium]